MIYIMRGLPGSGKSTWARKYKTFSADEYHVINGVYQFDPKRAAYAHKECLRAYLMFLRVGISQQDVAVDNTNTTLVELAPYVRLAEVFCREYKIVYLTCDVETAIKRNVHNVPANTILQMNKNLITEIVPPYWNQDVNPL